MHVDVFAQSESEVRYYCRKLPNLLSSGRGALVRDVAGNTFVDFISGCGALNYGHNHAKIKRAAIEHLSSDGILAGLDFHTDAKLRFLETFRDIILKPRGLRYKLQFPGPTGANCVEAAIKLARKVTGRSAVVAFTNAFHGMSTGALALTGSWAARRASAPVLGDVIRLPFDGYRGAGVPDLERFEAMANDPSGGIEPIAAIIVEVVQGEGGLNVATTAWLRALSALTARLGALLIVDDIQAGCGRTGTFFSFERAEIVPDVVCLAKSIGGSGLPMSLLLLKPEHDVWSPGEHNGTFRGNGLAFATAAAAIGLWEDGEMSILPTNAALLTSWIDGMTSEFGRSVQPKGIGMMQGLEFFDPHNADRVHRAAIARGVIVECGGPHDEVLKIMAPLNIEPNLFADGLDRVATAIREVLASPGRRPSTISSSSERNEAPLDPYDDSRDPVCGSELPHAVT
ncbi:diaminobutyrate-2-oxoglutarate transaminase [Bradyrhizobium elkanii]|jgi:diaminobutyrate-2-oxoglutarate transaminase|uniref:diaminobutyrate--2-oxoglutarate transaminase n=1 Tax=Bradyrhizobium elkanii TaxID=29448 RepID=UPI0021699A18|nr:diaminobutyrate--2-oxoglutarate transaminase [Bradyrhizobium elkanii]MCS3695027.1 diaminobutyrate-2-oxoglutarate transaminase [Bradyrhizobium elkanii]